MLLPGVVRADARSLLFESGGVGRRLTPLAVRHRTLTFQPENTTCPQVTTRQCSGTRDTPCPQVSARQRASADHTILYARTGRHVASLSASLRQIAPGPKHHTAADLAESVERALAQVDGVHVQVVPAAADVPVAVRLVAEHGLAVFKGEPVVRSVGLPTRESAGPRCSARGCRRARPERLSEQKPAANEKGRGQGQVPEPAQAAP
eukprot:507243-Rhodomonas_salina.1